MFRISGFGPRKNTKNAKWSPALAAATIVMVAGPKFPKHRFARSRPMDPRACLHKNTSLHKFRSFRHPNEGRQVLLARICIRRPRLDRWPAQHAASKQRGLDGGCFFPANLRGVCRTSGTEWEGPECSNRTYPCGEFSQDQSDAQGRRKIGMGAWGKRFRVAVRLRR
jgi:hypothetical protein